MNFFDGFDAPNPFSNFGFSPEDELNDYPFNSYNSDNSFSLEKDNDNIINTESKITQPTLNQNLPNENIINVHDLDRNQNKSMNLNGNHIIEKKIEFKTEKKVLGRKRKNSNEIGQHGKVSGDNIIRKIKSCLLNFLLFFLNAIIYKKYNGNIGEGKYRKEIFKMNQGQIINDKNNKQFIYKTLKDIFSYEISGKYTNFDSDHNEKLIEFLLNESDKEKRKEFQNLFSLTFLDCLNHFAGIKPLPILKGMKSLNDFCKKFEDDETYLNSIKNYVFNFEKIIMDKKSRNRTK
jgi:hypothetical protein